MHRLIIFFFLFISCNQTERCGTPDKLNRKEIVEESVIDGKALFQSNCASCHHPYKDGTGPALKGIFDSRGHKWIHMFITKRKKLGKDSLLMEVISFDPNSNCPEFPNFTTEQIEGVMNFGPFCTLPPAQ